MERADRPALRVVRVLTRPNLGGPTRQAIALWHAHRALGVQTLLVTGAVGAGERLLSPAAGGVPELTLAEVERRGADAAGWLVVPSLRRGVTPLGDLRAGAQLRRVLRAARPDVVHTHTSKAGWIGRRAAWAVGARCVAHTFHGHVLQDYFARLPSALLARLERRLAARTDLLLAVSGSCADELAAAGVAARERFVVVPPAVPVTPAAPRGEARRRLGIAPDAAAVCAVGRLVPIKRLEDFVCAVAAVPALRGDVFGGGPQRERLLALATQLAPDRVRLRDARDDAAELLSAYDAVVLSSVREGLPLVAVEAFAAGVPVVGYDVPGVRDALATLGTGVLVPPADGPSGLARALSALLADSATRDALVAQAARAVAACAPAAVARQMLDEYLRVLGAPSPAS